MGPFRKPSQEQYDRMLARQSKLQASIQQAETLANGAKSPFWKATQALAAQKLKTIEARLDNYEALTDRQVIALLEARLQQKFFISMADDFSANIKNLERELSNLSEEIAKYRERLRKLNG